MPVTSVSDEFKSIDKKHSGLLDRIMGGAGKARDEKMLALALRLESVQSTVGESTAVVQRDFESLNASLKSLSNTEAQLQQATDNRLGELEGVVDKTTKALDANQTKSSMALADKLEVATTRLRESLEATGESLSQSNNQIAVSVTQVSDSLNSLSGKLDVAQKNVEASLTKTSGRVDSMSSIIDVLYKEVEAIESEGKASGEALTQVKARVEQLGEEAKKLDADMAKTSSVFSSSFERLSGDVTAARTGIAGMASEVQGIELEVKKLPSEDAISKKVRQELGKRLMQD